MSATPSHNNTSELDCIVSNLLVVVGNLVEPAMQVQGAAGGFRAENNTGYTDNNVSFVKGLCHVFEPCYVPAL